MVDINRYDPDHDYGSCWMELHSSGDYVLFDDHEDALLNAAWDLKELQKKYDKLLESVGKIWREG